MNKIKSREILLGGFSKYNVVIRKKWKYNGVIERNESRMVQYTNKNWKKYEVKWCNKKKGK